MKRLPLALLLAVLASVFGHLAVLFGSEIAWPGEARKHSPAVLLAELRARPVELPAPAVKPKPVRERPAPAARRPAPISPVVAEPIAELPLASQESPAPVVEAPVEAAPEAVVPAPSSLPSRGRLQFAVFKDSIGMEIGWAEHRWEFFDDGAYQLVVLTETSGLAALIKPLRIELESRGQLTSAGLQPATLRTRKNGKPDDENVDFDWSQGQLTLLRNGRTHPLRPGAQDIVSLNYQLAYLKRLQDGVSLEVATGRKFERHDLASFGEEMVDTPAGRFRTLHVQAAGETLTDIWIALDHHALPVKIRFVDRRGDSFSQVLTEADIPPSSAP